MIYPFIFAIALILSLLVTPLSIKLGQRWQITDRPGGRRKHQAEISRLGGLALFAGFVGTGLIIFAFSDLGIWPTIGAEDRKLLTGVLLGSCLIFAFGLWDDYKQFPSWPQFVAQFGVTLVAIAFDIIIERATLPIFGYYEKFPFWITYPLTIFWIMARIPSTMASAMAWR